jgi:hypothetical protein
VRRDGAIDVADLNVTRGGRRGLDRVSLRVARGRASSESLGRAARRAGQHLGGARHGRRVSTNGGGDDLAARETGRVRRPVKGHRRMSADRHRKLSAG